MFSPNLALLSTIETAPPRLANSGKTWVDSVAWFTPVVEVSGISSAAIECQLILSDGGEKYAVIEPWR